MKKPAPNIIKTLVIKTLKLGLKGNYLNIMNTIKAIYEKLIANIILNAFPLKIRKTKCLLWPLLFNIVLKVLARTIRQKKKKASKTGKEEVINSSQMISSYTLKKKTPKDSTHTNTC